MIVVDAEQVQRRGTGLQVTVLHQAGQAKVRHVCQKVGRVFAPEQRIQEDPVELAVDPPGGVPVPLAAGIPRIRDRQVQGDAH